MSNHLPWAYRTDDNETVSLWKELGDIGWNGVTFSGPDREANAALFLRAQHMDELVEAARDALLTLERAGYEPFRNGVSDQNGQGDEGEYWYGCSVDNLRNALSKIEGKSDRCGASKDGECSASWCPQNADGEPKRSGRSCPLIWSER